MNTKIPVVVVIFNRPEQARELYQSLSVISPQTLYIISDGPRMKQAGEAAKVEEARQVFAKPDWSCCVYRNFAEVSMGCRNRILSGLDWVFEQEEKAIILEDDCIPHPDFFPFCEEMLERYAQDTRIQSICGTNLFNTAQKSYSYSFSAYQNCWGWATWRRAWKKMDRDLVYLEAARDFNVLKEHLGSMRAAWYWQYVLNNVKKGNINSWAYCWTFSGFVNNLLNIIPRHNLITNYGVATNSTHTSALFVTPPPVNKRLSFPLIHPPFVFRNYAFDALMENRFYSKSLPYRLLWLLYRIRQM
jgi:hypothetical protein